MHQRASRNPMNTQLHQILSAVGSPRQRGAAFVYPVASLSETGASPGQTVNRPRQTGASLGQSGASYRKKGDTLRETGASFRQTVTSPEKRGAGFGRTGARPRKKGASFSKKGASFRKSVDRFGRSYREALKREGGFRGFGGAFFKTASTSPRSGKSVFDTVDPRRRPVGRRRPAASFCETKTHQNQHQHYQWPIL